MSVFSLIKRGRAQAKEHSAKQADKEKAETAQIPYKHIPTHAASDALATAPSSWKQDDRAKIKEQNRKRSAMAASSSANHSGLPRVGSSLAHVSYPSVYANPMVPLPKNYSYSSVPSSWRERMVNTPELSEEEDYLNSPRDYKGKGREIVPSFPGGTGGTTSPMLSSGRASPMSRRAAPVSAGGGVGLAVSSVSENPGGLEAEKEIRTRVVKNFSRNSEFRPSSSPGSSATGERLHHLHPSSHSRKMSEPPRNKPDRYYPPLAKSTYFSAPRPTSYHAPSADTFAPTISPGVGQFYANNAPSSTASTVSSIGMAISTAATSEVSTAPSSITDTASAEPPSHRSPSVRTAPPAVHPRKLSLSEFMRLSSETVRPNTQDTREQSLPRVPTAPSIRGRRLSKSKSRPSGESERSANELNQPASITPPSLHNANPPSSKEKQARRRLSKDHARSQAPPEGISTSSKKKWSLFGRRNANKGA
ncbi:hypothetical protein GGR50DRAFT_701378 [Xylaria sp. CBS 124048]|nr:hypothetical protein GGR50DRAFT_701378 [Xylaria sp. CBS 124048]